jgi:integrase
MLTALKVKNAKDEGRMLDSDGLFLEIDANGNKSWVFRYSSPTQTRVDAKGKKRSKERFMGLGAERDLTLAEARDARDAARALVRAGVDPIDDRRQKREASRVEASSSVTFALYAEKFVTTREAGWKNPVHRAQWRSTLQTHVYPVIGQRPIADIDTAAVRACLDPIWTKLPETARRVRGRIEAILSAAKAEGLRSGENPAQWRGHLDQFMAKRRRSDVKHHAALPYSELPAFWRSLATDTSDAAAMLRFIILTACRFGEAAGMDASEVSGNVWTIPASRMKADRPHTVPLTTAALACLPFRPVSDVSLANCIARHTSTPATTHGFRSTFRDWAGDKTDYPREVVEQALAHQVGNEVERAYRRSTALEKRRELMNAWERYCTSCK